MAISEGALSGPLTDGALVLVAVCVYARWVVLRKRALRGMSAFAVTARATWFGAAIALPFSSGLPHAAASAPTGTPDQAAAPRHRHHHRLVPALDLETMSRLDTTTVAPVLLLIAPATLLVAWIWLDETPTALALAGGAVTLTGVAAAQLRRPSLGLRVASLKPTEGFVHQ